MNRSYISKLLELAERDSRVCHLLADSGTGLDEAFKRYFGKQIFNYGIAEENLIGISAGMAMVHQIPFVFNSDAFLGYRGLEFIRNDICLQNLNVKIVGMGYGLSWSTLGVTHHTTEMIGILRGLPNLMILNPATPNQVLGFVELAYKHIGPTYIRIGMNDEKEFFDNNYEFSLKNDVFNYIINDAKINISLFSTGSILEEVMKVKDLLLNDNISVDIINCGVLKPIDEESIIRYSKGKDVIFSIEEHNIINGLGSIIADTLVSNNLNCKLVKIGLNDEFAKGYGDIYEVRKRNKLDSLSIYEKIKMVLKNI